MHKLFVSFGSQNAEDNLVFKAFYMNIFQCTRPPIILHSSQWLYWFCFGHIGCFVLKVIVNLFRSFHFGHSVVLFWLFWLFCL